MPDHRTVEQPASVDTAPTPIRFPTAYTILFALIIVVAALTWIVPAGKYDRVRNEALDKDVPVPGTYTQVESNPQGVADVFMAPIGGFYKPDSYEANAVDVAVFVLIIGGFLGVVNRTGAIGAGIARSMTALKGHELWMIPILMLLFAAGGTTYGMVEETLAFYMLLIPVVIAAGFDALTGVAIILLGAGIGVLGSSINPFATVIASNAAGVPFTQGLPLRVGFLVCGWLLCAGYVMRYAHRVAKDPSKSLVADLKASNEARFLPQRDGDKERDSEKERDTGEAIEFTTTRKVVLALFGLTFAVMVWGVSSGGWWMAEMSALFLAPLADFSNVGRDLVVTAYQSASGIVNLVTPTSAVVMGALAIGRVPYERWLRFVWLLLLALTALTMAGLTLSV